MNARYLFPADYMADPAAHVWNGRIWIYPSHDRESGIPERDNGDHFDMVDYHALSIEPDAEGRLDPMTGAVVDHGVILDLAGVPWAKRQLWDSDVAEKDGRYYLYFCAKDKDDVFHIGAAELAATKRALGYDPDKSFAVPQQAYDLFARRAAAVAQDASARGACALPASCCERRAARSVRDGTSPSPEWTIDEAAGNCV